MASLCKEINVNDNIINTRIESFKEIIRPNELRSKLPITKKIKDLVINTRHNISNKRQQKNFYCRPLFNT